ncbi:MAG: GNAT family protein [Gammaproteobacteria bacterium]|nr:GNAT family protein [Gammaproteobacteria bacterium]
MFKSSKLSTHSICLEPLEELHRESLRVVVSDERISTYTTVSSKAFDVWFNQALVPREVNDRFAFAVRRLADHKLVGSTSYYDFSDIHRRVLIGFTWYHPDVWGTEVNPTCKYLLLQHAFETLTLNRVGFEADVRNARSRAAILKLGAKEEGIMRQHMIMPDGHIRDTVFFSILRQEWPVAKKNLEARLKINTRK